MDNSTWKIPYVSPTISDELLAAGFNPLLAAVLTLRGYDNEESARRILSDECVLPDPLMMKDMVKARDRVLLAIERHEKVAVYGDYDVDGITASCLLSSYLKSKGVNCEFHIPNREDEGYGLNSEAIRRFYDSGVTLIITVDCGITAVEEALYAKSIGIDLIITDHHECHSGQIPDALAVVDYKQPDEKYESKNLAGVGVAFKLACACEGNAETILDRYADLVAIGTVADVMPLTGENRYLVKKGLAQLNSSPRPGIAAMLRESSIESRQLTAASISFSIAPRLNAAGRLGEASIAARLLSTTDSVEATKLARQLNDLNKRRQEIEFDIWQEACERLRGDKPKGPIVLSDDNWNPGVIGIAASRLSEHYAVPSIIICMKGTEGKGSCRSYGSFNMHSALEYCSEHLISFGGHAPAAGLRIHKDKIEDFRNAINEYYQNNMPESVPSVQCDLLISSPEMLSVENVRSLDLLEPYGSENSKPVLCMCGVRVEELSSVGIGGKHLKMKVLLKDRIFDCIFFSHSAEALGITKGSQIDIAFTPQINEFRGSTSVQLTLTAARPHDGKDLSAAISENYMVVREAAAQFSPDRNDFITVWRAVSAEGFTIGGSLDDIFPLIPSGFNMEKFFICLTAFLESGLLSGIPGKGFFGSSPRSDIKVNLEDTQIIRVLRSL